MIECCKFKFYHLELLKVFMFTQFIGEKAQLISPLTIFLVFHKTK